MIMYATPMIVIAVTIILIYINQVNNHIILTIIILLPYIQIEGLVELTQMYHTHP